MLKLLVQGPPGRELLVKMKLLGLEVLKEIDIPMGFPGLVLCSGNLPQGTSKSWITLGIWTQFSSVIVIPRK